MRIIAGKYRHRLINRPNDELTRPTKDRTREAIFSSLGESVSNAIVLDLFAGSGAYGLEAISRGARKVFANDMSKEAISVIKDNAKSLGIKDEIEITQKEYLDLLTDLAKRKEKISLVFLDPPYALKECLNIIKFMEKEDMLTPEAIIVVETDYELNIEELTYKKTKRFYHRPAHVLIIRK